MKKGAPAYSPNNMKIGMEGKPKSLNFYTVLLTPLEYCVNYHWHMMSDTKTIKDVLKISKTLRDLFDYYKSFIGEDGALVEAKSIFGAN